MRKRIIQISIGLALSGVFAWLAVRNIQWHEFIKTLQQDKDWWYLLPAIILFMASFFVRAWRWHYFLQPVKSIRFHPLFSATMVGYMGNNILPVRLGEILRVYALDRSTGVSKSAGLATVVVERLVDVIGLLAFLIIAIIFTSLPSRFQSVVTIVSIVSIGLLTLLLGLTFFERRTQNILERIYNVFPDVLAEKLGTITESFLEGLSGLRQTQHYGKIIFQTLFIWTLFAFSVYFILLAFRFDTLYDMTFVSGIVVFLIGTAGVLIPSSPGYVGTFHFAIVQALALYGVPNEGALGFAIVNHLLNYIPVTALGLVYFFREGLRFEQVSEAAEEVESVEPADLSADSIDKGSG
ncbi:MAG: flippase-like domain-containing protein [Candidatus Marinimicrobia bacterium]|nr:flippase-like domain-containing protein [Candidatus Neomarinimicrobiota bacterium]MCF7880287.1 flippase-like domain-containing protein [Candidatus Neomarinimicrobiota bacterium]